MNVAELQQKYVAPAVFVVGTPTAVLGWLGDGGGARAYRRRGARIRFLKLEDNRSVARACCLNIETNLIAAGVPFIRLGFPRPPHRPSFGIRGATSRLRTNAVFLRSGFDKQSLGKGRIRSQGRRSEQC